MKEDGVDSETIMCINLLQTMSNFFGTCQWDIWWQNSELQGPPPVDRQSENITFVILRIAGSNGTQNPRC